MHYSRTKQFPKVIFYSRSKINYNIKNHLQNNFYEKNSRNLQLRRIIRKYKLKKLLQKQTTRCILDPSKIQLYFAIAFEGTYFLISF